MSSSSNQRSTFISYLVGFVLSIILTLTAFLVVADKLFSGWKLTLILLTFALVQLAVQLLFFLHLDKEKSPRLNLQAFMFAALVLVIIVAGSLWIMNNISYHHGGHSPEEVDQYLLEEEGIDR